MLCPEMRLQRKQTKTEVRTQKRKRDRQIRNKENAVLNAIIPRQILGDSKASVSSYLKRRKEQHFERLIQCGKVKSHSPAERNLNWDVSAAMDILRTWPAGKRINWSAEARTLGIPGTNNGQVLKEMAMRHGIDTVALDARSGRRLRSRKRRLPSTDISVGCGPSKRALKSTWAEMIQSG